MMYRTATGGLRRQRGRERRDFCAQVRRGHDPIDEAEPIRLLGADLLSGQKELEGPACANQAREALRAAVTGDEPEVDLGLAELRGIGRNAERAGHRELAPAAERVAVDRGNGRLAQMLDRGRTPAGRGSQCSRPLVGVCRASSLMSAPATNAFSPAPVMTTTRTASSSPSAVNVWCSSSRVCELMAFRTPGRLNVTRATASSRSTRRVFNVLVS